jgi:hypothetical protein
MTFSIPNDFTQRPCDRALIAALRADGITRLEAIGLMLQIWRDFAIARDDRRVVPAAVAERAASVPVSILEDFAGYAGKVPGHLVESAIAAGFFRLTPISENEAELVLTDFFPANHSTLHGVSASQLGGIHKGLNLSARRAGQFAREQLELFRSANDPVLAAHGEADVKSALHFVGQLCDVLRWHKPQAAEWRGELAAKAIRVLRETTQSQRDNAFRWFIKNRSSQDIPPRLDFVLDRFEEFVGKADATFAPSRK